MLNYLALDYEFKLKSAETGPAVEARLGTHFIPELETPEGWILHDITPIGLMLHTKYPDRPILPASAVQRIAAHLLEDGDYLPDDQLPETIMPFFVHMRDTYYQFLKVSREALAAGLSIPPWHTSSSYPETQQRKFFIEVVLGQPRD